MCMKGSNYFVLVKLEKDVVINGGPLVYIKTTKDTEPR